MQQLLERCESLGDSLNVQRIVTAGDAFANVRHPAQVDLGCALDCIVHGLQPIGLKAGIQAHGRRGFGRCGYRLGLGMGGPMVGA
jgi:hypothetical protein